MNKIGIIGAGNIGLTLAKLLLKYQIVDKEHLKISFKGNSETYARLKKNRLDTLIVPNETLISDADIIFLTIKPKDYNAFREDSAISKISEEKIFISTVAGHPISQLRKELHVENIYNVMPSGPETLLDQKGICALYPVNASVQTLMQALKIKVFSVDSEKAFYLFTTALCLPAAFLYMNEYPNFEEETVFIDVYKKWIPHFAEVYQWAKKATPLDLNDLDKHAIIKNMSTVGGVTENLVNHLKNGDTFSLGFSKALEYCEFLAKK
ncbi:NAD(P)-binding domain-containing protein [Rhizosphaericola mali]|uniref:Pyrroline-5-carboxylate reductase catalytic N-terminal domain-containing protein n=1 Tax=Rhizosphaericola mali TaxID=2545455 RepID=A0A5P2G326_9BACT|nr:NAD(P)-binding domain-containing protein [Rhizosphaericola mali]QES88210.1 hypothetical protein E0W69_005850 [Rhizosphaericola mali]